MNVKLLIAGIVLLQFVEVYAIESALWDLRAQVCLIGKQAGIKLTLKCTAELEEGKH